MQTAVANCKARVNFSKLYISFYEIHSLVVQLNKIGSSCSYTHVTITLRLSVPKQCCWDHCSCAPLRIIPIKDMWRVSFLFQQKLKFSIILTLSTMLFLPALVWLQFPTWFHFFKQIQSSVKCYWLLSMARSQIHKSNFVKQQPKKGGLPQ